MFQQIKISPRIDENRNTESRIKQSQNTVVQVPHPRSSGMNAVVNYLLATASPVLHQYYKLFILHCISITNYSAATAIHQYLRKPAQIVASQPLLPSPTKNNHKIFLPSPSQNIHFTCSSYHYKRS